MATLWTSPGVRADQKFEANPAEAIGDEGLPGGRKVKNEARLAVSVRVRGANGHSLSMGAWLK
eukprot:1608511-Pyramimonas_sp.AAC.1